MLVLEATIPTGFESVAAAEVEEKLGLVARKERGKIFFPITDYALALELCSCYSTLLNKKLALKLKCADNVFAIMVQKEVELTSEVGECLAEFRKLVVEADWLAGLKAWEAVFGPLPNGIPASLEAHHRFLELKQSGEDVPEVGEFSDEERKALLESGVPKFRVTCLRSGGKHCFGSPDVARDLGGEVQRCFGWAVSMKKHNVEVVLQIQDNQLNFGMALTRNSLHQRNISVFGPTTLRATLCYGMLRTGGLEPGDVLCDPLCGGGSIPIGITHKLDDQFVKHEVSEFSMEWNPNVELSKAALEFQNLFVIGGDNHDKAVERSYQNLAALPASKFVSPIAFFQWDATRLPLGSSTIDCIVTDMPFGKRQGSKFDNQKLYPALLREWGRVCKKDTGRAILLTQDKIHMQKAIYRCAKLWKQYTYHHVNIGGLNAGLFCLKRTNSDFQSW